MRNISYHSIQFNLFYNIAHHTVTSVCPLTSLLVQTVNCLLSAHAIILLLYTNAAKSQPVITPLYHTVNCNAITWISDTRLVVDMLFQHNQVVYCHFRVYTSDLALIYFVE